MGNKNSGQRPENLLGKRFGDLEVIAQGENYKYPGGSEGVMWICKCTCGEIKPIRAIKLKNGENKTCGHGKYLFPSGESHPTYKRGYSNHSLTNIWYHIKQRCGNSKNKSYKDYGGRGIKLWKEWKNDSVKFIEYCLENGWQKGLHIDRINNNGNYEPGNIRFITQKENNRNRRVTLKYPFNDEGNLTIQEILSIFNPHGLTYTQVYNRVRAGTNIKDAISKPILGKSLRLFDSSYGLFGCLV